MMERNLFIVLAVFSLLAKGSMACSNDDTLLLEERKIVGESLYRECFCDASENEIVKPKWIGPDNSEIRPGSNSGIETEERNNIRSLIIKKLSISMAGTYKCQCECGGATSTLEQLDLKVYNPLEIINTPEEQMIVLGDNSEIKCEGWGGLGERYMWWDKPPNKPKDKYKEVIGGLVVQNVTEEDRGIFICFVSDLETGAEVNRSVTVQVVSKPRNVKIYANPETTVLAGETLTLECVAEGSPIIDYSWKREEPVTTSSPEKEHKFGKNVIFEKNRLIFDNITAEDHGTYQCTATNHVGKETNKIDIEVDVPPRITSFNNTTAIEGDMVQLICEAIGRPVPNVSILYIGQDINGSKGVTDEDIITASFIAATPSREGYYVCNATSYVGFETSSMYLTVLHKPIFEVDSETVWGWDGITINLSCKNDANPKASVAWRYIIDMANPPPEEKMEQVNRLIIALESLPEQYMSLNITNTTDLYGIYECTAKNEHGMVKKTINLKQGYPPSSVIHVGGVNKSTEVTFFITRPQNYQGPDIIGYIAEYDISDSYNYTDIHPNRTWGIDREAEGFVLSDLIPDTKYFIKIAAINAVGIGDWSELFVFKTQAPSSPNAPNWDTNSAVINATEKQALKWTVPSDNGAPIDYYLIRYCANCINDEDACKELRVVSSTEFHTESLEHNTTYCLELRAHNSVGISEAASLTVTVAALTLESTFSAGAIIGVAIVVVLVAFIVLDVLLCVWRKQGMIASFYYKKSKKRKTENEHVRDKKGLLKENSASTAEDIKKHKEFEYNKSTGIITGKHSSV